MSGVARVVSPVTWWDPRPLDIVHNIGEHTGLTTTALRSPWAVMGLGERRRFRIGGHDQACAEAPQDEAGRLQRKSPEVELSRMQLVHLDAGPREVGTAGR